MEAGRETPTEAQPGLLGPRGQSWMEYSKAGQGGPRCGRTMEEPLSSHKIAQSAVESAETCG